MTDPRAQPYVRLAHDVGKYIARIAHNIGDGPIPAALVPLLARDLYELPGDGRASEVFAERVRDLREEPELTAVREHLAAIDTLEEGVRAGEEAALREAAHHALAVERELRELARRITEADE